MRLIARAIPLFLNVLALVPGGDAWAGGKQVWVGADVPTSIAAGGADGTVWVTGYTALHVRGNNYATFAYDASTGRTEWSARYDGQQNGGDDDPAGIAVSPDGAKVLVTGRSYDATSGGTDLATVAYKG